MTILAGYPELFQTTFRPSQRGVVGLSDHLVHLFGERGAVIECREGRCYAAPCDADSCEVEIPLTKSLFRPLLARIAAMCNERKPGSVSPYGGEGELQTGGEPVGVFRVRFTNTIAEQRLEIRRAG